MLKIVRSTDRKALRRIARAREVRLSEAEKAARRILADVRRNGDSALIRYSKKFDQLDLEKAGFIVTRAEIRRAYRAVPKSFVSALHTAARNIRAVARRQLPRAWEAKNGRGIRVGQIVRPLDRIACYVPGGRFPLPSTVLMSVIPAQVAGVHEIIVTSPRPAPAVLVAADFLGVEKIYRLGGAQAIAAFAYGTRRIPRADKIVGPGNRYVAAAKKLIAGECGIDFVAGPTELVVVGASGKPEWVAADLVAQAEHDPDALALLITPSMRFALRVRAAAQEILRELRLPVAEKSLAAQGAIILARNLEEAAALAESLAPEHLTMLDDAAPWAGRIRSAGSIFLGSWSPVAAGDYASGPNHILPTGGAARLRGGLTAADFVKVISVQKLDGRGLRRLRRTIVTLANTEGLKAHAYSIDARFQKVDEERM